ncbi:MAG: HAD-IA family hydrolase [Panacagrimonas sp.]
MSLQALLFDVDGTVADTERFGHRPAYNKAFQELDLGFRWSARLYRELLRQEGGKERIRYYVDHYQPDLGVHQADYDRHPEAWVRMVHQRKSRHFRNYLQRGQVPLRPGIARLLREARRQNLKLALVSNASRDSIQPLMRYGLGDELSAGFDLVVTGDDVKHKKPAPEGYEIAMQRLGLRSDDCIALEDSSMGLRAALAAHLPTVVTVNSNTVGSDFSGAALVVDNLGEPDRATRVISGTMESRFVTLETLQSLLPALQSAA